MPKPDSSAFTRTLQKREQNASVPERAHKFIASLHQLVAQHALRWHEPTVSHDEDDNMIEISWWRESKALIFTVEPDSPITFLRVWGPHIFNEMEDGESPSGDQLIDLWQWLYA